jgi:hypothetical protein
MPRPGALLLSILTLLAAPAAAQPSGTHSTVVPPVRLDTLAIRARGPRVVGVFRQDLGDSAEVRRVDVLAGHRKVTVRGWMPVRNTCYRLGGAAARQPGIIYLVVDARPGRGECPDGGAAFFYEVSVRARPGTYTIRVVHRHRDDPGGAAVVREAVVTVR